MNGRQLILVLGDMAALLGFAVLGLASHEDGFTAAAFARTFVTFGAAWLVLGWPLGAFHLNAGGRAPSLRHFLAAWLVCGAVALGARSLIFDRALFTAFFVIALAGNGLFLAAWRTTFALLSDRFGASPSRPAAS
jgi:hypothetical protein